AYTSIASLDEYVLVAQEPREAAIFRRLNNWKAEKVCGTKARITLRSLRRSLPLAAIYEGV
ncbi:MAG: Uma2 family endonuclease, partial [Limisphaerales bacterium]